MSGQIEITVEQLLIKIGSLVVEIDMLREALRKTQADKTENKLEVVK